MDISSEVKSTLYKVLFDIKEEKIQKKILANKSSEIIDEIIAKSYQKLMNLPGKYEEKIGVFGESLIHYLLTNSLIPSQRKIITNNVEIDIVIPDVKTLNSKPVDSLIIHFVKTLNVENTQRKFQELLKMQPNKNNIWIVGTNDRAYHSYSINKINGTFSKIIDDINEFLSSKKIKFKILKTK